MPDAAERFRTRCRQLHDLQQVQELLDWDREVMMPRRGTEQRGAQLQALAVVIHEHLCDPELGDLLAALEDRADLDEHMRADVREMARERARAVKVPAAVVAERARACALAQGAWTLAYRDDDFAAFLPHLEHVLALTRTTADALVGSVGRTRYDALLDEYEPGMTEAQLEPLLESLVPELRRVLARVQRAPLLADPSILRRSYPIAQQEVLGHRVLQDMGFDLAAGRLDRSVHPFTSGALNDVRITTRYEERFLSPALFALIHEAGHGLYQQGLDPKRYRDPAGSYCSLGVHESQSRLWENIIARSRPFWVHYYPQLRQLFPGVLDDVDLDTFYRAINDVRPSAVRVEADEVTYNLHITLRFRLERALLEEELAPADLPAAWREGMNELLGFEPSTDREGALQDVHWAAGLIGYFPTYTLGNLLAAQLVEAMHRDMPDFDDRLARGELLGIKQWLNEAIHRHGRRYLAPDLCQRVTGRSLSPEPYVTYLDRKFGALYPG